NVTAFALCFDAQGKSFFTLDRSRVNLFDANSGQLTDTRKIPKARPLNIAYNSEAKRLFVGADDGTLHVWEGDGGDKDFLAIPTEERATLLLSSNGRRAASLKVGPGNTPDALVVRMWDTETGGQLAIFKQKLPYNLNTSALSPDGTRLVL